MNEINNKNKLIAVFMGGIYSPHAEAWGLGGNVHIHPKPIKRGNKVYKDLVWAERFEKELKYHSSWDWLMPVVDKISALCEKDNSKLYMSFYNGNREELLIFRYPLEKTWELCIEFIEWYNTQNIN